MLLKNIKYVTNEIFDDKLGGKIVKIVSWSNKTEYRESINHHNKEHEQCLIDEIITNRYAFSGLRHQTAGNTIPIFDDNKCCFYSHRGWGRLMAKAWSQINNKDYDYNDFYMYLPPEIEENIPA